MRAPLTPRFCVSRVETAAEWRGLAAAGVAAVFPLAQARRAYERAVQRHLRGKVVLQVAD